MATDIKKTPSGVLEGPAFQEESSLSAQRSMSDDEAACLGIRNLVYDMTMQHGLGHGGSAVGMAAIGVALWKYVMRFNPEDPTWFDRDRFVLSNGHASMFLYVMNYLVGYKAWTMEQLKGYGADKQGSYTTLAHAHPEIGCPAVEVTTGPLGQGVANAVGLAVASKHLAANFNKPGFPLIQSHIYCMTGDGCLMEGVAMEAISLAGNLQLDNLTLIYDNNQVTCDGPLSWINQEDTNMKMQACGWHVADVYDGTHNVQAIVAALREQHPGKPSFINIRTTIGAGTRVAGTAKAHHGTFDVESVARSKSMAGLNPGATHEVPDKVLAFFRDTKTSGGKLQEQWSEMLGQYQSKYAVDAERLLARVNGWFGHWASALDSLDSSRFCRLATRESNGLILEMLWKLNPAMCGGGADLVNSNKFRYSEDDWFHPAKSFAGRYIRHGIREHAMAAIANGLAAYHPGTFLPVTATFSMFYLYAAPAVRIGALSKLHVLHIATHDSFQEGQNGPTHQPVELDSLFRAMPNLIHIRPCNAEEVIGAYQYALRARAGPVMISVARDPVAPVPSTRRGGVSYGAYVLTENTNAHITLVSCGSELHYVVAAAESLKLKGIESRVVSAPSLDLFDQQTDVYRSSVLPLDGSPIVSAEEYVPLVWARYVTASIGMKGYGYSASNESNYERFGLNESAITAKVIQYLGDLDGRDARRAGWRQL
ncbi:uncharacterized protein Z520_07218 [Fonsecaea multimorphosa CBS 102226]|uniref:Transketolase-like pyrimidine-binding domain-containing protein n=1 Tax=Fonsecaea multimorphosa CBS 102226 TaxID=1442371 RepID=A0A0D2K236_9EURO|nr:uncharacterized protein Z520_07218 [Fonsecaea multimorphosa CBS 102226]KIX97104.1 hypothetical protein Z520_07218 [Fonsecaea multimorphosa CBS 102226]OAL22879.1 hypothetical protein AYO22_06787 [Fonsecaea multimorphosa]